MAEIDEAIVGPWKKRCGTCAHFYVVTKRKVYVPSNFPGGFPDDLPSTETRELCCRYRKHQPVAVEHWCGEWEYDPEHQMVRDLSSDKGVNGEW